MSKRLGGRLVTLTTMALAGLAIAAGPATAAGPDSEALQMYEATVTPTQFAELQADGFDVVDPEPVAGGVAVDLVLTEAERAAVSRTAGSISSCSATRTAAPPSSSRPGRPRTGSTSGATTTAPTASANT